MRSALARCALVATTVAALVACASAPAVPDRPAAPSPSPSSGPGDSGTTTPAEPGTPADRGSHTPQPNTSAGTGAGDKESELTGTSSATDALVVAAGDIAECSDLGDETTAGLVAANPSATVLVLGDAAYPRGSTRNFENCYAPSWGVFKARTRPSPGNHEYQTSNASGYFTYFGAAAGDPAKGYYSYDLGAWHLVALNTNCNEIGGCGPGSPQEQWLRADLHAHRGHACTLAYMHHPRFSSGQHGDTPDVDGLWRALAAYRTDVVLAGHDHNYERFQLMNADGVVYGYGMRLFVVGTGGASIRPFADVHPNTAWRSSTTFGVLKLNLRASGYDWRFLPAPGSSFTDIGSAICV